MPSGFLYGYVYTQLSVYIHENVEPILSLVPLVKAFALPCSSETSNAESGSNNIVVFLTIQYYCLSLRHE